MIFNPNVEKVDFVQKEKKAYTVEEKGILPHGKTTASQNLCQKNI